MLIKKKNENRICLTVYCFNILGTNIKKQCARFFKNFISLFYVL